MPLVVIAAGALAFAVIARGLGPSAPEASVSDAQTTETPSTTAAPEVEVASTSPPPPPLLRSALPIARDGLRLVTQTSSSAQIGEWVTDAATPTFNVSVSQPYRASYSSDGARVAIESGAGGGSIVIDSALGGEGAYIQDASSGSWHVTNPSLFAWTQIDGGLAPSSVLKVADVSGFTGAGIQPLAEFDLGQRAYDVVGWGDWGFVAVDRLATPATATVFDPDGLNPIELEGVFFDVSADGQVLMARLNDFSFEPYLYDRDSTEIQLVGLDLGATDFRMTVDGAWVLALTPQADGHTSILARTVNSRVTRLTSVDGPARIVGEANNDRYLVLQDLETGDLIFKDWQTRAEYKVSVDAQVAAVYF